MIKEFIEHWQSHLAAGTASITSWFNGASITTGIVVGVSVYIITHLLGLAAKLGWSKVMKASHKERDKND
jgi:hypothetical protein